MPTRLVAFFSVFLVCLVAPASSRAQSRPYLRISPELGMLRIEHTKQLTDSSGSSSTAATSTGADFAVNLSVGYIGEHLQDWLVGGEIQFAVSSRQAIAGSMPTTGSAGPGTWDFSNLVGVGANLFFGSKSDSGKWRSYLLVGIKRWTTEMSSGALDPELGEYRDRDVSPRWPWTVGIGTTLLRERRLDIRLRYFRSVTDWSVRRVPTDPDTQEPDPQKWMKWDYEFTGNGISLQIGFGTG